MLINTKLINMGAELILVLSLQQLCV